jgi:ligand-binding SRPBCC domain-containing protein
MLTFDYQFTVRASLTAVNAFHRDARALKRLSPPPFIVQLHRVDPLGENSIADFTLWLGPLPIRWTAIHSAVSAEYGFTDTQQRGLMKFWKHNHRFTSVDAKIVRVSEHIEYEHATGLRGLLSRLLFNPLALRFLFAYRGWVTRRALESGADPKPETKNLV